MGISSIGSSGLDPFSPTQGPPTEETRETPPVEAAEKAPLPEGAGVKIDTSA
jgi:hypothetical protein